MRFGPVRGPFWVVTVPTVRSASVEAGHLRGQGLADAAGDGRQGHALLGWQRVAESWEVWKSLERRFGRVWRLGGFVWKCLFPDLKPLEP